MSAVDRFGLFPTPVFVYDMDETEDLNAALRVQMMTESESGPGLLRSNVGTWHSPPDLSQRTEPIFRKLFGNIVDRVNDTFRTLAASNGLAIENDYRFNVQSWAMVTPPGGYVITHDHVSAHFSTAYYVDAGDADLDAKPNSGLLAFIDPGRATSMIPGIDLFPSTFTVQPKSGRLVIFPGTIQHYVHPYHGTRERICISSNVRLEMDSGRSSQ